jgi:hypothetical protein
MIFTHEEKKLIVGLSGAVGAGGVDGVRGGFPFYFQWIDAKSRFTLDSQSDHG